MNHIKAIGFDLFNTLITVEPDTLIDAISRLIKSLRKSGFEIEEDAFKTAYRQATVKFVAEARETGRETHNRFWISEALSDGGDPVSPDDDRIGNAVEHYFSAFYDHVYLIPGTKAMLDTLKGRYNIGLLSNFTHGPAARVILEQTGITAFFKTILISGEMGYRKPHPFVFEMLAKDLGAANDQVLYVGDDPDPDIHGAQKAGLQPVWMTYVRDNKMPMTPGMIHSGLEKPDFDVPSIGSWEDLFSLLEGA